MLYSLLYDILPKLTDYNVFFKNLTQPGFSISNSAIKSVHPIPISSEGCSLLGHLQRLLTPKGGVQTAVPARNTMSSYGTKEVISCHFSWGHQWNDKITPRTMWSNQALWPGRFSWGHFLGFSRQWNENMLHLTNLATSAGVTDALVFDAASIRCCVVRTTSATVPGFWYLVFSFHILYFDFHH